ncbi:MAG: alpha/beta fold hydrolase [Polyangiaceae bacterium]
MSAHDSKSGGSSSSSAPMVASSSAAPVTPAATPLEVGTTVALDLVHGQFDSVRARFNADVKKALSSERLRDTFLSIEGQYGEPGEKLAVREEQAGKYNVVIVTFRFGDMPLDVRVVLEPDTLLVAGLNLKPSDQPVTARPQLPKPPFPYGSREVTYENPKDHSTIAGTLTLPAGAGKHPAVLLITGSGSQDRDETIFGHKPFLVIADHLSRQGFVVLRVDDRGIGGSNGDAKSATIETHATDVEAGLAFLGAANEVDPKRIGLIGHSEGGIIASLVASRDKRVAFVVSLAGTGLSGAEINPLQVEAIMKKSGAPPEKIASIVAGQRDLMGLIARDAPEADIDRALGELVKISADGEAVDPKVVEAKLAGEKAALLSPWFKSFVKLDPRETWQKVKVPVLALNGSNDVQVPSKENLAAIGAALEKGGNKRAKLVELANLNHLFQTSKTGLVSEYALIEETFAPAALDALTAWLLEVTKS